MGTRSNTLVIEFNTNIEVRTNKGTKLVNMYRQFDGYPSGHGKELAEFLAPITLVNGMGANAPQTIANGVGCLAAQIVAHFKTAPGGIYLAAPNGKCDNDYTYIVSADTFNDSAGITVEVKRWGKKVFEGNPHQFLVWCEAN